MVIKQDRLYKGHAIWTGGDLDLGSAGGCFHGSSSDYYFIVASTQNKARWALRDYLNPAPRGYKPIDYDWDVRREYITLAEENSLEMVMMLNTDIFRSALSRREVFKVSELESFKERWENIKQEAKRSEQLITERRNLEKKQAKMQQELSNLEKKLKGLGG